LTIYTGEGTAAAGGRSPDACAQAARKHGACDVAVRVVSGPGPVKRVSSVELGGGTAQQDVEDSKPCGGCPSAAGDQPYVCVVTCGGYAWTWTDGSHGTGYCGLVFRWRACSVLSRRAPCDRVGCPIRSGMVSRRCVSTIPLLALIVDFRTVRI
jgi:hypothetical protein